MTNRVINKVTSTSGNLPPVLLDLTNDTVNERNLERDQTAHNSGGQKITGQMAIEDAEAWARGTRNGTPVGPADETYNNNSKYYSIVSGSIMQMAGQQAIAAATSATNAAESERAAATSETNAKASETAAANSAVVSGSCMNIAGVHAGDAEAWAIGKRNGQLVPPVDPAYNNNSKYYKDLCESIAGSLMSVLKPKGTCLFADLPAISDSQPGDLWNIEDEFTTTSDFREGAGRIVAAGSNVYLTIDNKWDILAGVTSDYIGCTSSTAAIHGLMPAAQPGEQDKVIFGDGRWKNLPQFKGVNGSIESVSGLLPEAPEGAEKKVFYGKGEWGNLPVFRGISGSIQSISGMLPAAENGDEDKVFNGRGEWGKRLQIDIVTQNGQYGYINANNEFVAFKSQADIDAAVAAAMVGTATAADVKEGVTFTNSTTSGVVGTFAAQEKTVTAGTSAKLVTPDSGKYLSKVTYNPTPSQEKSTTASRSAQTITPDSGKLLSKVTIAKYPDASGTYKPTARSANNDMTATNNYRYVDTRSVPSNSQTAIAIMTRDTSGTGASLCVAQFTNTRGWESSDYFNSNLQANAIPSVSLTYGTLKYNTSGTYATKWTFTFNTTAWCNGTKYNSRDVISWYYYSTIVRIIVGPAV